MDVIWQETGIKIDTPTPGGGTSDTGNVAWRMFSDECITAILKVVVVVVVVVVDDVIVIVVVVVIIVVIVFIVEAVITAATIGKLELCLSFISPATMMYSKPSV